MKASGFVLSAFLMVFLASCTTLVTIKSNPPGAQVVVNSRSIGDTPVSMTMSNALWERQLVMLTKRGFTTLNTELVQEIKLRPLIAGFFVWPLWLWAYGPAPDQYFVLEPN